MKCQFTLYCFNVRVLQGPGSTSAGRCCDSDNQLRLPGSDMTDRGSLIFGPGRQRQQILRQIRIIIIGPQAGLEPGASPSLSFTARKKGEGENRTSVYRSKLRMPCDSATGAVAQCVIVRYIYDPGPGPAHTVTVTVRECSHTGGSQPEPATW